MNYKKLITFFATSIFLCSMAPTLTVHAEEDTKITEDTEITGKTEITDNEGTSSIKVEEKQFWEVEISEDVTLEGFDTSGFEYAGDEVMSTLDIIDKASNDNIRGHLQAIAKEYDLPEECPADLCISYSVEGNGKIVDVKIDYTEVEEIEEDEEEILEIIDEPVEEVNESQADVETEADSETDADEIPASDAKEASEETSDEATKYEASEVEDSKTTDSEAAVSKDEASKATDVVANENESSPASEESEEDE